MVPKSWFASHLSSLFSRDQQARVDSLPQQNRKNSMKEDLIDIIIAPSFIRESANRAAKHISGWISSPPRESSPKRSKKTNRLSMLLILNPTNFGGFSHYSREKCVLACINKARQQLKTYSQRRCSLWDSTIAIYFIIVSIYLLTDWPPHLFTYLDNKLL